MLTTNYARVRHGVKPTSAGSAVDVSIRFILCARFRVLRACGGEWLLSALTIAVTEQMEAGTGES